MLTQGKWNYATGLITIGAWPNLAGSMTEESQSKQTDKDTAAPAGLQPTSTMQTLAGHSHSEATPRHHKPKEPAIQLERACTCLVPPVSKPVPSETAELSVDYSHKPAGQTMEPKTT